MRTHRLLALVVLGAVALTACAASEEDGTDESSEAADPFANGEATSDVAAGEPAPEEDEADAGGDDPADDPGDFGGVELTLETVSVLTWDEDDDAFQYGLILDGEDLATPFGPPMSCSSPWTVSRG